MIKKIVIFGLILFLAACCNKLPQANSHSNTYTNINFTTSGTITQDEIWRGEIHITGDISLGNGVTLSIEPGTTIYLAANSDDRHSGDGYDDEYTDSNNDPVRLIQWSQNAILINGLNGTINAIGTSEKPITFCPEGKSTSPAQWDGILIQRGTIQHAKVLYGGRTPIIVMNNSDYVEIAYNEVRYFMWSGINSFGRNVWIHNNIVEGGGHQGIAIETNDIVENNMVLHSQTGISVDNGDKAIIQNNIVIDCSRGMELRSGNYTQVINNTIVRIQGPPDGWFYQGRLIYPAFQVNDGIGNFLQSKETVILNNILFGQFDQGVGLTPQPEDRSIVDYSMFWGQSSAFGDGAQIIAGIHNYFTDPLFINSTNYDFHLRNSSPAIDAGNPDILDTDGSPSDLGAYGGPKGTGW